MEKEKDRMSKFNKAGVRPALGTPVLTTTGTAANHEGGPGFTTDARGELFRLATANFVGEDTFYESADARDGRFNALVRQLAVEDFPWLSGMLTWLRSEGNMRSASLTGAAQAVEVRGTSGLHEGNADLVDAVLQRADEPGEFLAYWHSQFGKGFPARYREAKSGLKRAAVRLYTQRAYLKWDSAKRGYRFADVIRLVHPAPADATQDALFAYILKAGDVVPGAELRVLSQRKALMDLPLPERKKLLAKRDAPDQLKAAGMTWEALAGWLQSPMDATAWEAVAPTMGYMALLRNLRGMDEAGISNALARKLADKIADSQEVARSRQLPYRFLSAYLAAPSDRWKQALTEALEHSLDSVPELPGRTLVLVDTSASMNTKTVSANSKVTPAMAGALFGVVLAARQEGAADLYGFAGNGYGKVVFAHSVQRGASVLKQATDFVGRIGEAGHGTQMSEALRQTYDRHDRVVIVSDMQCFADRGNALHGGKPITIPQQVPVYGFNIGGYGVSAIDSRLRTRHEFTGLTDQVFSQIRSIEAGNAGRWPWKV